MINDARASRTPRTWTTGDPEPDINVTAVRHSNGQTFVRAPLSSYSYWRAGDGPRLSWEVLTERLERHTLTEVLPDAPESACEIVGPVDLTSPYWQGSWSD